MMGIPCMAHFHYWIFFPCCLRYLIAVLGMAHQRLHQPILLMLATKDLSLTVHPAHGAACLLDWG